MGVPRLALHVRGLLEPLDAGVPARGAVGGAGVIELPATGAREILQATYDGDPVAVRGSIMRAYILADGDPERAAAILRLEPFVLAEWVRCLALTAKVKEMWP